MLQHLQPRTDRLLVPLRSDPARDLRVRQARIVQAQELVVLLARPAAEAAEGAQARFGQKAAALGAPGDLDVCDGAVEERGGLAEAHVVVEAEVNHALDFFVCDAVFFRVWRCLHGFGAEVPVPAALDGFQRAAGQVLEHVLVSEAGGLESCDGGVFFGRP